MTDIVIAIEAVMIAAMIVDWVKDKVREKLRTTPPLRKYLWFFKNCKLVSANASHGFDQR